MPKQARTDRGVSASQDARRPQATARVWDAFVRLFHWGLALSFAVAWFSSHSSQHMHQWAGYSAAGLIAMRLIWGFLGTPYARFSQFVHRPPTVVSYLLAILRGQEARFIGHNPAGGAMIIGLIAGMIATALTGWMMTTDTYFGVEWVERSHDLIAHGLLLLVFVHVAGVLMASFRHRENLVLAMITGRKRRAEGNDVA